MEAFAMPINYILIDFENILPLNLALLDEVDPKLAEFHVLVFVGAKQKTISFDFAQSVQNLGKRAQYIQCSVTQKNAVDFLLSYHLGRLIEADPKAYFHIISKDTGFDSLVMNLLETNHKAYRHTDISDMYIVSKTGGQPEKKIPTGHVKTVVDNLKGRGSPKPVKVKTLKNTIANLIKADPKANAENVFNTLVKQKFVIVDGEKVSYNL
jgi:hypothetical protein